MSADKPDQERDPTKDQGFLARWSRRKQDEDRARTEGRAKVAKPAAGQAVATTPAEDTPAIDLTKLPKIEDLTGDSNISVFLQKGVPEELRRLALRKAWTLDPTIRDFVEMAENQYDWNKPDGVPGFGPLAPDVDIKALLSQAIGEWPAKLKPPAEAADALDMEAATARAKEQVTTNVAGSRGGQSASAAVAAHAGAERLTLSAPKGDAAETGESAPHAGRRRHGGALPQPINTKT